MNYLRLDVNSLWNIHSLLIIQQDGPVHMTTTLACLKEVPEGWFLMYTISLYIPSQAKTTMGGVVLGPEKTLSCCFRASYQHTMPILVCHLAKSILACTGHLWECSIIPYISHFCHCFKRMNNRTTNYGVATHVILMWWKYNQWIIIQNDD